jgi:drug/metabolite transporter (DMT)-like permease
MRSVAPEAGVLVSIVMNVGAFTAITLAAAARGLLPPIHPWSIPLFAAGGLVGTLVGRNLVYHSLQRISASLSTTVRLANGAFALLIAFALLRELPRPTQLLGMAVVTVGLWISLRPGAAPSGHNGTRPDPAGVLMALGGSAAFALGDTARRAALHLTPAPVLGATIGATVAMLAHLVWSVFHRAARWPSAAVLRRPDVMGSAALNTLAILLLYVGLRHTPVAIVSVLYNLQVLVVLIVGPLLLHEQERLTVHLVVGALLALAGTALILLS